VNPHQDQGDEGLNAFHLAVHIKVRILLGPNHPHWPQAFGFLASSLDFRNTAHEVAPLFC
jgi:hypothetical protein